MDLKSNMTVPPSDQWTPCPMCWGQRRIYEDRNGEGLVPTTCPSCLGIGEICCAPEPLMARRRTTASARHGEEPT